jgi:hypothetical protein
VSRIGRDNHKTGEVCRLTIRINSKVNDKDITALISCEAYVMNRLKANMLIGIDTICSHSIDLHLGAKPPYTKIGKCESAIVPVRTEAHQQRAIESRRIPTLTLSRVTLPAFSSCPIEIKLKGNLSRCHNYLFRPDLDKLAIPEQVVDSNTKWIVAHNSTDKEISLPAKTRLRHFYPFDETAAFHVDPGTEPIIQPDSKKVRVLENGITIYDDGSGDADIIQQVVKEFDIFRDKGFADMPQEECMPIPMRDNWEKHIDQSGKVYAAGPRDREVIDETHNRLHAQGRMGFIRAPPLLVSQFSSPGDGRTALTDQYAKAELSPTSGRTIRHP